MSRVLRTSRSLLLLAAIGPLAAGCEGGASDDEGGVDRIQSALTNGTVTTDLNLKVAFVGDTADGTNWKAVLDLIKNEGASAIVTLGDMTYDADPNGWWTATESKVSTSFPVFLARGNHDDSSWSGFLSKANSHLGGATRTNLTSRNDAYKTVYRGLTLITIHKGDTAANINTLVGSDNHIWRVCTWHQNQNKMQVGGKGDEMGWAVYEACRQQGAIILTGHEHSYERTKTMTNITNQTRDSTCSSGSSVCVGLNRTTVSVVGTGGTGLRGQTRCTPTSSTKPFPSLNTSDPSCPIWASIYTTNQGAHFGALFITFNAGGVARKATAYFKDINNNVIDTYTITHD